MIADTGFEIQTIPRATFGADLGVTQELVPTLVQDALADLLMTTTPKYPSAEQVKELYEAAL